MQILIGKLSSKTTQKDFRLTTAFEDRYRISKKFESYAQNIKFSQACVVQLRPSFK